MQGAYFNTAGMLCARCPEATTVSACVQFQPAPHLIAARALAEDHCHRTPHTVLRRVTACSQLLQLVARVGSRRQVCAVWLPLTCAFLSGAGSCLPPPSVRLASRCRLALLTAAQYAQPTIPACPPRMRSIQCKRSPRLRFPMIAATLSVSMDSSCEAALASAVRSEWPGSACSACSCSRCWSIAC